MESCFCFAEPNEQGARLMSAADIYATGQSWQATRSWHSAGCWRRRAGGCIRGMGMDTL
ncbi:hypothetical protein QUW64_06430 [Mediterranea massiliensis]|nr:hypothetical protein [Mediterranea massiliensis]MDM8337062.1 hypothetical protein [Mediterranea massiliensis]